MEYNPKPLTTVEEQRAADYERADRWAALFPVGAYLASPLQTLLRNAYIAGAAMAREEAVEDGGTTALRLTVWEALDNLSEGITPEAMKRRSVAHEAIELTMYCAPLEQYGEYESRQLKLHEHIRSWRRMVKGWEE